MFMMLSFPVRLDCETSADQRAVKDRKFGQVKPPDFREETPSGELVE
jgi:hypothetical protein